MEDSSEVSSRQGRQMGRSRNTRLGRNDPCWCRSGKKYKNCHQDRNRETPLAPNHLSALVERPFLKNKVCFYPGAPEGCGKVIRAHTLQRSGIIQRLIGMDNHVQSFHPLQDEEGGSL